MEWELTDDEMSEVLWQSHLRNTPIAKALAQEQAKKLVEWLSNRESAVISGCECSKYRIPPHRCHFCWHELRRQVGLE